ncbi:ferredoxin [Candidatus Parcubacteria bacterium]|jgi:ferredoxin|nr:MAG: ferredoxin [Candidatus Parcubacteria bacterium]
MPFKSITVDREKCISAATCVAVAPEVFELDGEGKAVVKNATGNDDATIIEAAKSCPTQAIIVISEDGKQLVP